MQLDEKGKEYEMSCRGDGESMKSASFASKVAQRGAFVLPSAPNPGPGAYNPKDDATIEHLPGANPAANPISKVNRDARYVGDTMVKTGHQTGPGVGPGSYDPRVTIDGAGDSVGGRSEMQRMLGWSASFISGHLRQLWQGWFGDNDELNSA